MDDWAEVLAACVVAAASAFYAQFGVQLERVPPAPRAVRAAPPRRRERAAFVVVQAPTTPRMRRC